MAVYYACSVLRLAIREAFLFSGPVSVAQPILAVLFLFHRIASHASEVNVAPGFSPALSFSVPHQARNTRAAEQ
jgi:hypothetical protein